MLEKELDKAIDADIEFQEAETKKTNHEKLMEILLNQQFLIEQCMILCKQAENEILAAKRILEK